MQRREEQASEHDHQPAEAGDQLMPHQLQLGLQIGPDLAQVGSDELQILLGSNVVVDRIEDLGSDALGFLAIDVGVRQGVGQGKPVSQWRLRLARSAFGRGGRPVRNRPCRGAHPIRRAAILAPSARLREMAEETHFRCPPIGALHAIEVSERSQLTNRRRCALTQCR